MSIAAATHVAGISARLQALQRHRTWYLKSRNMVANRLQATVAGTIGYDNAASEKERQKKFAEADKLIAEIKAGNVASEIHGLVMTTVAAIDGFDEMKRACEKEMVKLAKQLPIAAWVERKDQRGFGLLFLAIVIGETGDLANYANPAKVWRRLGCAPYTKDGVTQMGATWRIGKGKVKMTAEDWESFGYSPRRRSIAYLIGEGLVKQNQDGPYRSRYDEAKTMCAKKHADYSKGRCHHHGMLLATKFLLKNLWVEWNDHPREIMRKPR